MQSSLIGFIVQKDVALLDELWALNEEEKRDQLSISVVGTIDFYEDFLAGYATWKRKLTRVAHTDIQNYNPLNEEPLAEWLHARREKYPALMIHLQQLQDLRSQLLAKEYDL